MTISTKCPFCGNDLDSRTSKCFNLYCQGQRFNVGNLVLSRVNKDLGLGKIIKKLDIPTAPSIDNEDSSMMAKFKVRFDNNLTKILHPVDLIHYVFKENDEIRTRNGIGVVNSADIQVEDGQISYEILFSNGKKEQVSEDDVISKYEMPVKRQVSKHRNDPPQNFLLKYWSSLFLSYYTSYQIKCITNSRLSLLPHQINVAHRLSEELFPRMILADEVGLGKTIEAGIYIKEMMARSLAERILIIVPATLVSQWKFEMENKFNISFTIYDGKKMKELTKKGSYKSQFLLKNPFYYDNLIICSLQFARNPRYAELLSQISWDVVIFDEAHHLRRYLVNNKTGNYRETLNYELAKKLSQKCESLLLLTATPLQLHSFELFSLVELVHPELFPSFAEFEHFRKNLPFINLLLTNIQEIDNLNTFELKNTLKLLIKLNYVSQKKNSEQIINLIKNNPEKLATKIERDHTLSKILIRNRKKNVISRDFINKRVVNTINVQPTKPELDIYNEIRLYLAKIYSASLKSKKNMGLGFIITTLQKLLTSSKYAIMKSIERKLEQISSATSLKLKSMIEEDPEFYESELEEEYLDEEIEKDLLKNLEGEELLDELNQEKILKDFYNKLKKIPYDSKSKELVNLLNEIQSRSPNEKVLIFTQFVDTLFSLKRELEDLDRDFYVELFYGGLDKEQKDEAVERFRSSKDFSILLSTEVGGEGRNFQFCRIMINYDLPWNPMKLEQRIGRLDRIGQESREIYIYNFFIDGTIETDIVYALIKRINLFEESVGILEPIIGRIEKDMKDLIFLEGDRKKQVTRINEFNRTLDEQIKKARELELQLDDLLIDKKSFQMDGLLSSFLVCEDLKLNHDELFSLMRYFFGLENKEYGTFTLTDKKGKNDVESMVSINIKEDLRQQLTHNVKNDYSGTFNLELARKFEKEDFFALGHPLINQILTYCDSSLFPGTFTILKLKRDKIPNDYEIGASVERAYLFIFKIKFQGFIIEAQISSIILDESGKEMEHLSNFMLQVEQYDDLFLYDEVLPANVEFEKDNVDHLRETAKFLVKKRTSTWKKEVKSLNDKIFKKERNKKQKIHDHKKQALKVRLENLKKDLQRNINRRPSRKQLQNMANLKDPKRKKEREEFFQQVEENIRYLEKAIQAAQRKLDDLTFEYNDFQNEMKRKNLAKFYTNLEQFALIEFK